MFFQKTLLVLTQGWYGQRIALNLRKRLLNWKIFVYGFPRNLPDFVEEPETLLPRWVPQSSLILSLGEHPAIALLLPSLAKKVRAKAVITPIDNSKWVPPAVKNEVLEELKNLGVVSVFPKPFCSLEEDSNSELINEFAEKFGRPKLKISLKNGLVVGVEVLRGAPCGSTHFVAERLLNVEASKAPTKASLLVQTYPCLASRQRDVEYGDSLIHVAGYILRSSILEALRESFSSQV